MVQKRYTISTKLNEHENEVLTCIANRENISISAILKLVAEALINGDIEVQKGELKICTPPHEQCVSEDDFMENLRYKELKLDRLVSAFEDNQYPDHFIRQQIEMLVSQIRENGKFNPRRSNSDWGC